MEQNTKSDSAVERSAMIVATLTSFMGPFMISSVNVAMPAIQADFQMDAVQLSWIATAYLLAMAVGLVPAGKIADIHGRKKVFATGLGVYTLGAGPGGLCQLRRDADRPEGSSRPGGRHVCHNRHGNHYLHFSAKQTGQGHRHICRRRLYRSVRRAICSEVFSPIILVGEASSLSCCRLGCSVFFLTLYYLKGEWLGEPGQQLDITGCLLYAFAILAMVYGATRLPASILGTVLLLSRLAAVWSLSATS